MAITNWLYFSAVTEDGSGTVNVADWGDVYPLTNILTDTDGGAAILAEASPATGTRYSSRVKPTNPGLPSGLVGFLNGIEIEFVRINVTTAAANSAYDEEIALIWDGTIIGNNKASATAWVKSGSTATSETVTYGGSSDRWGSGISLSAMMQNPEKFGVSAKVKLITNDGGQYNNVLYKSARVRFYYSPGAMMAAM